MDEFGSHIAGRHEEAVRYAEQALRLDPFPPGWYFRALGQAYSWVGRYEEAIAAYKKSLQRAPNDILTHLHLTTAYSWAGRLEEAHAQAAEVLRINPKYSLERAKTILYKNKTDRERWINALRTAGLPEKPPLPLPDKPSIAVLPFVNMSEDPKQEYFSDGISSNIITQLYKIPNMFVIAKTSSFSYKGKAVKVQQVGRDLGVRYVLEGSVQKAGNRIRITAQLNDGTTGNQLWAESYDRELKDLFDVQDEITRKVVTEMAVKIAWGEIARSWTRVTENLKALDYYLLADKVITRVDKESNVRGRELLMKAIELDPKFARAIAYLGVTHLLDVRFGWVKNPRQSFKQAEELVDRALAIDKSDYLANFLLSRLYTRKRQYQKAIHAIERAVESEPSNSMAIFGYAQTMIYAGKPEEGLVLIRKAMRLSPYPPPYYYFWAGCANYLTGRYEGSITFHRKYLELQKQGGYALLSRASIIASYMELGRMEEAQAEVEKCVEQHPDFSIEAYIKAMKRQPFRDYAFLDRETELLRKAGLPD